MSNSRCAVTEPETVEEARMLAAVALMQLAVWLPDDDELCDRAAEFAFELAAPRRRSKLRLLQSP